MNREVFLLELRQTYPRFVVGGGGVGGAGAGARGREGRKLIISTVTQREMEWLPQAKEN